MRTKPYIFTLCLLLVLAVASCGNDDGSDDGDDNSAQAQSSARSTTLITADNITSVTLAEELRNHTGPVTDVEFSPDGTLLASASEDLSIRIWDFESGEQVGSLNDHTDIITDITFSNNGQTLVSSSLDGTVRFWNLENAYSGGTLGENIQLNMGSDVAEGVGTVAFTADGTRLLTGHEDGMIRVWDFETHELLQSFGDHSGLILVLAFNADESLLASGGRDRLIKVWDFASGEMIAEMQGHTEEIYSIMFNADSSELYSTSNDRHIRGWSISDGSEIWRSLNPGGTLYEALMVDGLITAASGQNMVSFFEPDTGQRLAESLRGHNFPLRSIAINPEGTIIVTGSNDFTIQLWYIE